MALERNIVGLVSTIPPRARRTQKNILPSLWTAGIVTNASLKSKKGPKQNGSADGWHPQPYPDPSSTSTTTYIQCSSYRATQYSQQQHTSNPMPCMRPQQPGSLSHELNDLPSPPPAVSRSLLQCGHGRDINTNYSIDITNTKKLSYRSNLSEWESYCCIWSTPISFSDNSSWLIISSSEACSRWTPRLPDTYLPYSSIPRITRAPMPGGVPGRG